MTIIKFIQIYSNSLSILSIKFCKNFIFQHNHRSIHHITLLHFLLNAPFTTLIINSNFAVLNLRVLMLFCFYLLSTSHFEVVESRYGNCIVLCAFMMSFHGVCPSFGTCIISTPSWEWVVENLQAIVLLWQCA